MFRRMSRADIISEVVIYALLALIVFAMFYPMYFIVIASVSDAMMVLNGQVWLWPRGWTALGYSKVFENAEIFTSYGNTVAYAGVGMLISLALMLPAAYALSSKQCPLRRASTLYFVFTMYFGGGLVPTYLAIMKYGLIDTFAVMVLPGAVSVYYMIMARAYFSTTVSDELRDAAMIDGCGQFLFFARIVLPLSSAIIAVLALYTIVDKWNSYFDALIYLRDRKRLPLQMILREYLVVNTSDLSVESTMRLRLGEALKYSLIVVTAFPIMVIYPFLQKNFTKGVMLGSLKG